MSRARSSAFPRATTQEFRFVGETPRVLVDVQNLDGSTLLGEPNQVYRLRAETAHPLLVPVADSADDAPDTPDAPPEPGAEDDTTPDPS